MQITDWIIGKFCSDFPRTVRINFKVIVGLTVILNGTSTVLEIFYMDFSTESWIDNSRFADRLLAEKNLKNPVLERTYATVEFEIVSGTAQTWLSICTGSLGLFGAFMTSNTMCSRCRCFIGRFSRGICINRFNSWYKVTLNSSFSSYKRWIRAPNDFVWHLFVLRTKIVRVKVTDVKVMFPHLLFNSRNPSWNRPNSRLWDDPGTVREIDKASARTNPDTPFQLHIWQ